MSRRNQYKKLHGAGMGLLAHPMVAKLAIDMAHELFEIYMRVNTIYRRMRADGQITEKAARMVFVSRVAPNMLEEARSALATMLALDDTAQCVKDEIYEALLLDSDLRANRMVTEDVLKTQTVPVLANNQKRLN